MLRKKTKFGALMVTSCLSLGGCSMMPGYEAEVMQEQSNMVSDRAFGAMEAYRSRPSLRAGGAQVSDGVYVAPQRERNNASALLPSKLEQADAVVVVSRDALTLTQVAERLSVATGIDHMVASGPASAAPSDRVIVPNYTGKLSDVLNAVGAQYGVEWSYVDGRIVMREFVTRQYQIPIIPSDSGSTFWSEFTTAVDNIIDSNVVYTTSPSSGLLTVTARIDDHAEIREFVDEVTKSMTQQVAFDVNVVYVSLKDTDGASLDLNAALANLDNVTGDLTYSATGGLAETTSGMNFGMLTGDFSFEAAISALSSQGRVTIDTSTGVTTLNNRSVPVEVTESVSYIASVSSETDSDTGVTRLVPQPSTQDVGFTLELFPRIMNSEDIMVEFSLDLSELKSLESFGSGETQVQLPEVSSTTFSQQAILQNGTTLVVSGFERNRRNFTRNEGASAGGLFGVGGSKLMEQERVATVLMIRPRIIKKDKPIGTGQR